MAYPSDTLAIVLFQTARAYRTSCPNALSQRPAAQPRNKTTPRQAIRGFKKNYPILGNQ